MGLGFLRSFVSTDSFVIPITGMVFGGGVCLLVYVLCHGRGLGGGDVKLAAAGGAVLGGDILYALLFACVCAIVVQVVSVDKTLKKIFSCGNCRYSLKIVGTILWNLKKYTHTFKFAFAPYMALGMEVVLFIEILQSCM